MERIDKQIVASGLGLLSVAGLGTGLAHADTVQRAVNHAVVSLAGQHERPQAGTNEQAPLKIASGKVVGTSQVAVEQPKVYEVQAGDSLWGIATAQHVSVDDLVASNQGSDLISTGQKLVIPTTDTSVQQPVPAPQPRDHTAATVKMAESPVSAPSDQAPTSASPTLNQAETLATQSRDTSKSTNPSEAPTPPTRAVNNQPQATRLDATSTNVTPAAGATAASGMQASTTPVSTTTPTEVAHEDTQQVNQPTTPDKPLANATSTMNNQGVVSLAMALAQQNIPYVWGGADLSGFDCSGLVSYVFQQATGKPLPHSSVAQEGVVQQKAVRDAQPGDLLFWGNPGASYHVAIYIGNQAYVAAPEPGKTVRVEKISPAFMPSFAGQF